MSESDIGWLRESIDKLQDGQEEILRVLTDTRLLVTRHDGAIGSNQTQIMELNASSKMLASRIETVERHMVPTEECLRHRGNCAALNIRSEDKTARRISQWIAVGALVVAIIASAIPLFVNN
jgi:hypothetical protein